MGEMADYYIELMEEGGRYFASGRGRHPSPKITTCDRCGATGLKWHPNDAGDWRLYEDVRIEGNRLKQHECNPASADDFEDLS